VVGGKSRQQNAGDGTQVPRRKIGCPKAEKPREQSRNQPALRATETSFCLKLRDKSYQLNDMFKVRQESETLAILPAATDDLFVTMKHSRVRLPAPGTSRYPACRRTSRTEACGHHCKGGLSPIGDLREMRINSVIEANASTGVKQNLAYEIPVCV